MRIFLGKKVINSYDVEQFFLVVSVSLYVTSVDFSIIWFGPFRSGCNFSEIPFCMLKFGIKKCSYFLVCSWHKT